MLASLSVLRFNPVCVGCLQHNAEYDTWETRYVFLLWIGMLCLIPFDICSMDSHNKTQMTTDQAGMYAYK